MEKTEPKDKNEKEPAKKWYRSFSTRILLAVLIATLLLGSLLIFKKRSDKSDNENITIATKQVSADITVGKGPSAPVSAGGHIWIANTQDGTISRINPKTDEVTETISVGRDPSAPVSAGGHIWIANTQDGTISRINPKTGEVTKTIAVGEKIETLSGTDSTLIVPKPETGAIAFINTESGNLEESIEVGENPMVSQIVDNEVLVSTDAGETKKIDLETKKISLVFETEEQPRDLLWVDTQVWTAHEKSIDIYDSKTGDKQRIPASINPSQLVSVGEFVWAKGEQNISRIDSETGTPVNTRKFETEVDTLTQVHDELWVTLKDSPQIFILNSQTAETKEVFTSCPDGTTPVAIEDFIYLPCPESETVKKIKEIKVEDPAISETGASTTDSVCDNELDLNFEIIEENRYDFDGDGNEEHIVSTNQNGSTEVYTVYTQSRKSECIWIPVLTLGMIGEYNLTRWCIDTSQNPSALVGVETVFYPNDEMYGAQMSHLIFSNGLWKVIDSETTYVDRIDLEKFFTEMPCLLA